MQARGHPPREDLDGFAVSVALPTFMPVADIFAPVSLWTRNIRNMRNARENVGTPYGRYACYAVGR